MSVGSWALLGFVLLAAGELARESTTGVRSSAQLGRFLIFLAATICIAVAFAQNVGIVP